MKRNFYAAMAAAIVMGLSSCKTPYFQVYTVSTDGAKQQDNSLVFENEDCQVFYNLWSENGEVKFALANKTDRDIFVNMGQTFFIDNDMATDYYQSRSWTEGSTSIYNTSAVHVTGRLSSDAFWGNTAFYQQGKANAFVNGIDKTKISTRTTTVNEQEIVCIPAHCYKVFNYYEVNPLWYKSCKKNIDFPSKTAKFESYTKETTPEYFTNRIAYGFDKDVVAPKHIDNNFWISDITNYSKNAATELVKQDKDCYDNSILYDAKVRQFKIGGPNKFYKIYYRR